MVSNRVCCDGRESYLRVRVLQILSWSLLFWIKLHIFVQTTYLWSIPWRIHTTCWYSRVVEDHLLPLKICFVISSNVQKLFLIFCIQKATMNVHHLQLFTQSLNDSSISLKVTEPILPNSSHSPRITSISTISLGV